MDIGLVGCGRWGANILRDLRTLGCRVHVPKRSEATNQRALEGGAILHEALPGGLDGMVVATPTSTHADVVMDVLARTKCPVFVEKPIAAQIHHAMQIEGASHGRVFVMDKWRYHGGIELIARMNKEGRFGPLDGLKTVRVQWGNPHADVHPAWTYLPHDIAIIREILGIYPLTWDSVVGQGRETAFILAGSKPWACLEFSCRRPQKRREVTAFFRDATVILANETTDQLDVILTDGTESKEAFPAEMPLLKELRVFTDYLRGNGPPPKSTATDGLIVAQLIDKLRNL